MMRAGFKDLSVDSRQAPESVRAVREDLLRLTGSSPIFVGDVAVLIDAILTIAAERTWKQLEGVVLDPAVPFINRAACAAAMMHARRKPGRLRTLADASVFFDLAFAGLVMENNYRKIGDIVWDALRGLPVAHAGLVLEPLNRWRLPALMEAWWVFGESLAQTRDPKLIEVIFDHIEHTADAETWLFDDVQRNGTYLKFIEHWRSRADQVPAALADAEVWRWTDSEGIQELTAIVPIRQSPAEHGICAVWTCRADLDMDRGSPSLNLRGPDFVAEERERLAAVKASPLVPAFIGRTACEHDPDRIPAHVLITGLRMLAPPSAHFRSRPVRIPSGMRTETRALNIPPQGGNPLVEVHAVCVVISRWFTSGGYRMQRAFERTRAGLPVDRYDRFFLVRWLRCHQDSAVLPVSAVSWQEDVCAAAERVDQILETEDIDALVRLLAGFCTMLNSARWLAPTDRLGDEASPVSAIPLPMRTRLALRTLMLAWTSPMLDRLPEMRKQLEPVFGEVNGVPPERCEEVFADAKKAEMVFDAAGFVLLPEGGKQQGRVSEVAPQRWDRPAPD